MRLRIDLHVHSVYSQDSYVTFEDAIRRCHEEGLDGFAFTDHDAIAEFPVRKAEEGGVVFIQGVEISAVGAHVLAFDIDEIVPMGLSISDTVDRIHDQGGIAIVAHPYSVFRTWVSAREIEDAGFDCVEVANAAQFPYGWMLGRNTALARKLELPVTGGSDAHIPRTIGRAHTILETEARDVEGILGALRKGETEAEGRGISLSERMKLVKD
ncbi:MAG: CehA/McbA family metallohydrolase [Candidatus Bathyarchaeota archaeon]|nr:CehA/McbA family metallohydrolase [Candidatus Bathyarchaeota archaeon]